ncbi:MAG: hypothetical protein ACLRHQ_04365 [Sellimonas intestinalis]|uniref:hypothetical protein n=1 Tax=Sellimonas intestinalis TaxID=1653434 RepID=UPI0039A0819D
MTGFIIALISGALMSVQGVFNTQVTKDDWNVGQQYVGAVLCFHRLPCCLVCGGKRFDRRNSGGTATLLCCSEEQSEQGSPGLLSKA